MGMLITVFNLEGEKAVEAAGPQRELEIAIDLHGDRRGEGVHVEEVDTIGDSVFNEPTLSVTLNPLPGGARELFGEQEGRLFVAEIRDDQWADGTLIIAEGYALIEDARRAKFAGDAA